jgi:hypothetical protein
MPEYLSRHGTKPASGKRCGRRGPSPVADGAKSAAGTVNHGDDRRDEHRGQDHQKDSGCAEVLRHGFTHISAKADGIGPDANVESRPEGAAHAPLVIWLCLNCLEVQRRARLPIGQFSSPKGGTSARATVSKRHGRPGWAEDGEIAATKVYAMRTLASGRTNNSLTGSDQIRPGSAAQTWVG